MRFVAVKNWDRFQHYKHRNPPWIKLHSSILDDYTFGCLQDASKVLLMLLWVLAAKTNNEIPDDPEWIKKRLGLVGKVDLKPLIEAGFLVRLQDASDMLAPCVQSADSEKSRVETEKSREEYRADASKMLATEGEVQAVYQHYLTRSGKTETTYALTPKRKQKIKTRLEKFTVNALNVAIDACFRSAFHQGENDKHQTYNDLADHILRNHEKVEWWLEQGERKNGKH